MRNNFHSLQLQKFFSYIPFFMLIIIPVGGAGPISSPRGEILVLVLIIVLLRAGLGLDVRSLYRKGFLTIMLSFFPYFCEFFVEMVVASYVFHWSYTEAGLYASALAALSPALVISCMIKLVNENLGGAPKQVLAAAPMEVVISVIIFNVFGSLAQSDGYPLYPWVRILPLWANIVLIPVNIVFSSVLGFAVGWTLSAWYQFRISQSSTLESNQDGVRIHKIKSHIARATSSSSAEFFFLFLISAYVLYALCTVQYIQQSSGVLAVFSFALTVVEFSPHSVVHDLKEALAGVWVFAEVALFTLVGAALSFNPDNGPLQSNRGINTLKVNQFCQIMFVGMAARFVGVTASYVSFFKYLPGHKQSYKYFWPLVFFTFLSTVAKATVQATLGSLPLQYQWLVGVDGVRTAVTIQQGTSFSILVMAPIGALLTQAIGRPLAAYLADLDRKADYLVDFDESFEKVNDPVFLSPVEALAEETADMMARHMHVMDANNTTFIERVHQQNYSPASQSEPNGEKVIEMINTTTHSNGSGVEVVASLSHGVADSTDEQPDDDNLTNTTTDIAVTISAV